MKRSTRLTTITLILAVLQGPILFYYTFGFVKLFGVACFGSIGLILSIVLLSQVLKNKSTNTKYHIWGLALAFVIGISTILCTAIEYLDFTLRLGERTRIIEEFKSGELKSKHLPGFYFLPISNAGDDVDILENRNGIISIGFYIDRGFIDHASEFLYTNNPDEIRRLKSDIAANARDTSVKKLTENWYRVAY